MIPNYQECMKPFLTLLKQANGTEVKLRDIINGISDHFQLIEESI